STSPSLHRPLAGAELRFRRQLLEQLALTGRQGIRNHETDLGQQISFAASLLGEAATAQADLAARGGAGGDLHPHRAGGRLDLGLAAQRRFPGRDGDGRMDVRAVDLEARVRLDLHLEQQIARRAAEPRRALAGEANLLTGAHARRNLHRQAPALAGRGIREGDLLLAALHGFLDGEGERRLGVAAALRTALIAEAAEPPGAARRRSPPRAAGSATAKQHVEERAEPLATAHASHAAEIVEIESAATVAVVNIPTRRNAAAARLPGPVPGRAILVVLLALVRVLENLVGLADLLELDLGLGVLVHVRMELARQLLVRLLDLVLRGILLDAQRGVIVLVVQCSAPPPRDLATYPSREP